MPFDPNVPNLNNPYQTDIDKMRENFNQLRQHEKVSNSTDIDNLSGLTDGMIIYVTSEKAFYGVFGTTLNKVKIIDENGFNNFIQDPNGKGLIYGEEIFTIQNTINNDIILTGNENKVLGVYYMTVPAGKKLIIHNVRMFSVTQCLKWEIGYIQTLPSDDCAGNYTPSSTTSLWQSGNNFEDSIINQLVYDNSTGSNNVNTGFTVNIINTSSNQVSLRQGSYYWLHIRLE